MLTAPSYSFQAPATSRDISTTAEFIRAWLPELGWLNWNYLGSLMTGYARNPSPKYQLISYVILSFALSEAMGLFCLMVTFSSASIYEADISTSAFHSPSSHVSSTLYVLFPVLSP